MRIKKAVIVLVMLAMIAIGSIVAIAYTGMTYTKSAQVTGSSAPAGRDLSIKLSETMKTEASP